MEVNTLVVCLFRVIRDSMVIGFVGVLRSNCGYHSIANLGGLTSQSYEFIVGDFPNEGYLTTSGSFCGQTIRFSSAEGDALSGICSPSIIEHIVYCLS